MQFYKYSGSGNDFIFFDNLTDSIQLGKDKMIELCRRREGIGADGVVFISKSEKQDFKLSIFNADGSEAEMCGNASRCSIHFAREILKLKNENQFQFETMNGVYSGELLANNEVKIKMTELYDVAAVDISDLGGRNTLFLNTGVPHAVIQVSCVDDVNVSSVGAAIRHDERFKQGTNVDFFEVPDPTKQFVKLRVYERGVEDETLCCGTGVLATAISCAKFFKWTGEIKVSARGGELTAIVDLEKDELYFQGPVKLLFNGEISG